MSCCVSAINCNGNHRGVKNGSASHVAKLTISTGCRVAGMLYSMVTPLGMMKVLTFPLEMMSP